MKTKRVRVMLLTYASVLGWWIRLMLLADGWWLVLVADADGWCWWLMADGWWLTLMADADGWWLMADGWWLMADGLCIGFRGSNEWKFTFTHLAPPLYMSHRTQLIFDQIGLDHRQNYDLEQLDKAYQQAYLNCPDHANRCQMTICRNRGIRIIRQRGSLVSDLRRIKISIPSEYLKDSREVYAFHQGEMICFNPADVVDDLVLANSENGQKIVSMINKVDYI